MPKQTTQQRILKNTFIDTVRTEMRFDEAAYKDLTEALAELATSLRGAATLDRELALALYSIPLMTRNAFLAFSRHPGDLPAIATRLEDAWVELDALVTECLADPT